MRAVLHCTFLLVVLALGTEQVSAQVAAWANPKTKGDNQIVTGPTYFDMENLPTSDQRLESGFLSLGFATEPGLFYRVISRIGTTGGPDVGMRVEILSATSISLGLSETYYSSPTAAWAPMEQFDFQATTPISTLSLVDISPGGVTGTALAYDSVVVVVVPEPAVNALLCLGLIMLALRSARHLRWCDQAARREPSLSAIRGRSQH